MIIPLEIVSSREDFTRGEDAEGVGSLYLKRLSDAIAHKDPIRAIVRGTAVNYNGKTPGITMPSIYGQEEVIRKCYSKAGLSPNGTSYVECHGTGTPVGDPIELEALGRVFSNNTNPLLVGSVKSNVGHSEATSAISGLIKTIMALEKGRIPASIGVERINPSIKTGEWNLEVVTKSREWPDQPYHPRRAGVNSFGYGGSNSHVILEEVVVEPKLQNGHRTSTSLHPQRSYLIPISATSLPSLHARVTDIGEYSLFQELDIVDLVYTLAIRRSYLSKRAFLIASPYASLNTLFQPENLCVLDTSSSTSAPARYGFVLTGQGAQNPQMCIELFHEFPVFRECIDELDHVLKSLPQPPSWSLTQVILEPALTSLIHDAAYAQPCCTAIQIGMIRLLESWDIKPSALIGHSSGEIVCAYAAGLISSSQAIAAAYYRGFVVSSIENSGAMMVVAAAVASVNQDIEKLGLQGKIMVACENSAQSTTISGDTEGITAMLDLFQSRSVFARKLNTGGRAYHSHHMLPLGETYQTLVDEAFERLASPPKAKATNVLWISSVTGLPKFSNADGAYWRENLESPVLFSTAVEQLFKLAGNVHLIEIGPHSALEMPIKQCCEALGVSKDRILYSSAIIRGKDSAKCILSLAGNLFLRGEQVSFKKINGLSDHSACKVLHDLPSYKWHYDGLLWNECRASVEFRQRKYIHHELLGSEIAGSDGLHRKWRNLLRVSDVPWLQDHKLDDTVVFPGAAYIAMSIEALSRILELQAPLKNTFRLRNIQFTRALRLSIEPTASIEIFTNVKPYGSSSSPASGATWEFTISSFNDGSAFTHATGLISSSPRSVDEFSPQRRNAEFPLETIAPRTWYQALAREGLNFGPSFQSISEFHVPRMRDSLQCTTQITEYPTDVWEAYVMHPITIDAMLQTSIVATAGGLPRSLKGQIPVAIEHLIIQPRESSDSKTWNVDSEAQMIGFGAFDVDTQLYGSNNIFKAQVSKVRFAPFEAAEASVPEQRHPVLRALWKPDIDSFRFAPTIKLVSYLDKFVAESRNKNEGIVRLGACLDLLSHKNPRLRILELGGNSLSTTEAATNLLQGNTPFRRFASYTVGSVSASNEVLGISMDLKVRPMNLPLDASATSLPAQSFDLVFLPNAHTSKGYLEHNFAQIEDLLATNGAVLVLSDSTAILPQTGGRFNVSQSILSDRSGSVFLFLKLTDANFKNFSEDRPVIVVGHRVCPLAQLLVDQISGELKYQVPFIEFDTLSTEDIPVGAIVFSLLELEKPLLSSLSKTEMVLLKIITNNASHIIWITSGNLLQASNPNFGLVLGLSRAIMMEQPALKFSTLDLDSSQSDILNTTKNIIYAISQPSTSVLDYELIQFEGIPHVCRFVPDKAFNDAFRVSQGHETTSIALEISKPLQLSMQKPGQLESIFFEQVASVNSKNIPADHVQIQVKAFGLNAKDLYVLGGRVNTKNGTCALEYTGVVEAVGSSVTLFRPGDRVVVMAPAHFKTQELAPEWACQILLDEEDFDVMSTIPIVHATALYALHDRARMQAGESILIHSGAGGLGIAAIQIAQQITANENIFVTVSTEDKKDFLIDNFGIKRSNIFDSRDPSFLDATLKATGGTGVNVVLNSLIGELLQASWRCVAPLGRFIEVGKKDIIDHSTLDMTQFVNSVTFSAFDLSDIFYHQNPSSHRLWADLLVKVLDLYRSKKIGQIRPRVFDISETTSAFRHFSNRTRMGKIAVSLENPQSVLQVRPYAYSTNLSPVKSYLMVGCLGGIGRSMSKWMLQRGARNFVFLGRSGMDKLPARNLIEDLERNGAICKVVRGDVCVLSDVQELVKQANHSIGGVVQAAMGLNESLFTTMSSEFWHTGIDPKVIGTWNLHNSLKSKDSELDFFMMTSSISGTVGTATESNYCAANSFLDMFARYRRSLNLPAISVGLGMISEVGYLHENPEIEDLLLRKGIHVITEHELLQLIDLALSQTFEMQHDYDTFAGSHLLTGMEPLALKELRKKGFEGSSLTMADPRAAILSQSIEEDGKPSEASISNLPLDLISEKGDTPLDKLSMYIARSFGNLVLLPAEKVNVTRSFADYGMDSMIAAEFRTWFFQAFKVDIPFLELLGKDVTVKSLAEKVVVKFGEAV